MNEEAENDFNKYIGWLAPDGNFFTCDRYGHDDLSKKLIEEYCKSKTKSSVYDEILICMGWCRMGYSTFFDHGYSIQANWKLLTDAQKSFIRNMYFEVGSKMTEDTINNLKDYEIIDIHIDSKKVDGQVRELKIRYKSKNLN